MLQNTIVFQKIWDAVNARNEDGSLKYRYIKLPGSSRSSKTWSLIDIFDLIARSELDKRLTAWRDTKTDCRKTVLNDFLKRLKQTGRYLAGQSFNKTEAIFQYSTGSTVEIHGTDDANTVHGLTQDYAWLNEPYNISKDTFDQIDQRTAKQLFLDLNPKEGHWSDDLDKDPRCIVIHSTFKDNPFCPEEQRNKILSYQPLKNSRIVEEKLLSEEEARQYDIICNPLNISRGRISELVRCRENEFKKTANEFNWSVYGLGLKAERPNRIFKWIEIPDESYHALDVPIYTGVDWGSVDPWGIIDAKYYDGALYLHERNYSSENVIREKLTTTELEQINAVDEGLVRWMFRKLQIPFDRYIPCDNNRPLKILALRDAGWDYSVAAIKPAGSVIDGIDSLNNIRVYFTASSLNLKYEQENYSRKVDRHGIVLEEPEDTNNHLIDPVRYIYQMLIHEEIIPRL